MPSPLRSSKKVWLVAKHANENWQKPCVCSTFRSAYKIACFDLQISDPCISERRARILYRKTGKCFIWNRLEFQSLEEAMWSPVGKLATLEEVTVRRT